MKPVRLRTELMRADGATFRVGTVLYVAREYAVDQGRATRLCLAYANGNIALPCCPPECVESIAGAEQCL